MGSAFLGQIVAGAFTLLPHRLLGPLFFLCSIGSNRDYGFNIPFGATISLLMDFTLQISHCVPKSYFVYCLLTDNLNINGYSSILN
jgi:hypothetical protein